MNFSKPYKSLKSKCIGVGDLIIVYERHDTLDHVYIVRDGIFQNKFGSFHHNDMIGKRFGSKIKSRSSNGWIYVLEPNPELWSTALNVCDCVFIECYILRFYVINKFRQGHRL
jgi:hypothetical protein